MSFDHLEQWKRIAGRTVQASPPLSRQYYQTIGSTLDLHDGPLPEPFVSYRRPGRSPGEVDPVHPSQTPCRPIHRRIFIVSSIGIVMGAVIVGVVLALTLGKYSMTIIEIEM